jgi:hypothetical protein
MPPIEITSLDLLIRSAGFDGMYEQYMKESVDPFFPSSYAKPPTQQVAPVEERALGSTKRTTLLSRVKTFTHRLLQSLGLNQG